jgi:hypothetical protein
LGDPLKGNLLLFYKPLHLEAQQVSTRIEVRRHQRMGEEEGRGGGGGQGRKRGTTEEKEGSGLGHLHRIPVMRT